MPFYFRKIQLARWNREPAEQYLLRENVPGDSIRDLATTSNTLSLWEVADDMSTLPDVIAAFASSFSELDKIVGSEISIFAGTLTAGAALSAGSISISGGTLQLATNATLGSGVATSNVNIPSLSITGNGTLDIGNNHIIIDYTSAATDPIKNIVAWIASGYAGGAWNGAGIISSTAQTTSGSYGVGCADGADPGNPAGLYRGQIEVMYT